MKATGLSVFLILLALCRPAAGEEGERVTQARLGAFLGISSEASQGVVAGGLTADLTWRRYFGAEAFLFSDFYRAPGSRMESSQYAALGQTKLQLPLQLASVELTPKVAAGYGIRGGLDARFLGPTVAAGMEADFDRLFYVNLEYLKGVGGQVVERSLLSTGESDGNRFSQISLGMGVTFFESTRVGTRLIRTILNGQNRYLTLLDFSLDL